MMAMLEEPNVVVVFLSTRHPGAERVVYQYMSCKITRLPIKHRPPKNQKVSISFLSSAFHKTAPHSAGEVAVGDSSLQNLSHFAFL